MICWWNSPDLLLLYIKNHPGISTSFPRFLVLGCISFAPIYKVCSRFICTIALATIWVVSYLCWAPSILLLAFSAFYQPIFPTNNSKLCQLPPVLWHCRLGDRNGIWPVNALLQYLQTFSFWDLCGPDLTWSGFWKDCRICCCFFGG